jgi:UDP-N-acetyl-D-galactosamine dehydrogenase
MKYQDNIGVVGLGYVGLPLAVAFSKKFNVIGFDIQVSRIEQLNKDIDNTLEVDSKDLKNNKNLSFTSNIELLRGCNYIVVTVPTPVTDSNEPDLEPLIAASETIAKVLEPGTTVIYESTVFPGATEEICIPILEKESGLVFNSDFFAGYSPERINPGDKEHRIESIIKVTSGSTPEIATKIDKLYSSIISAGTYKASSIKVAEAAKVIENTQRDVNIALINELSIIFQSMDIDTQEVLNAAGTKWNFLPFWPGLVGGHCIGVDPYYLTYKSEEMGYTPQVILAGRKINDRMGVYIADQLLKNFKINSVDPKQSKILVMGLTFKENCPDIRNTKVLDLISHLLDYGCDVECFDPWVNFPINLPSTQIQPIDYPKENYYDAIILAVSHDKFLEMGVETIRKFGKVKNILFDLKYLFSKDETDMRL